MDTTMGWIGVEQRFRVENNGVIRGSWEDDKNWMKIHSEREWKEMMDQACEIPVPEDNKGLPRRLVVAVPKKSGIISRL